MANKLSIQTIVDLSKRLDESWEVDDMCLWVGGPEFATLCPLYVPRKLHFGRRKDRVQLPTGSLRKKT